MPETEQASDVAKKRLLSFGHHRVCVTASRMAVDVEARL